MRRHFFLAALLVLLPIATLANITDSEKLDSGWILRDIKIEAPLAKDEPSWAYVNVQTVIKTPIAAVWTVLKDLENWPKWLPMTNKTGFLSPEAASLITPEISRDENQVMAINAAHPNSSNIKKYSGRWQLTAYELYDLPWPIKNEWVVRRYIFNESTEKNRASWKRIDSQLDDDDGFWELSPRGENKTLLKYYYRVKAKENVPETVFKTAVSFTVNSMIKALRHEATRRNTHDA